MIPEVSVVIVSYNASHDLERCLDSLQAQQTQNFETIVFDNGSSDGTGDMVAGSYPQVRLIVSPENRGLTRGVNQACRVARGRYICLLDADTAPEPRALETLREFLEAHPGAGVAAGRMLNPDGSIQETARTFPNIANAVLGRQTLLSRLFPNNRVTRSYLRRDDLARSEPFEVDWVAAACMMFPRVLIDRIGCLDEDYFVYWVDADWCMRVRRNGLSVWCVPGARVFHIEQNRSGRRKSARGIRSFHEGAYLFYRKHCVGSRWHPLLPLARAGLALRCGLLLAGNQLLKSQRAAGRPE